MGKNIISCILILVSLQSCGQKKPKVQNTFSPAQESLILFNSYIPVIEKKNNAIVDEPKVSVGDINGDQKEDCIIEFVMTSKDGGNLITGRGAAIYLNTGTAMKVVGAFPSFDFCYTIDTIRNEIIYGEQYECVPPYSHLIGKRNFAYINGKIKEIHQ